MLQPIVVGLDGSRESVAAAHWAAREALRRGLPLRLVHARQGPGTVPPALQVPQDGAQRSIRGVFETLTERYPHVRISTDQLNKAPVRALVDAAEAAELLVLGSRGHGGLSERFAGSVAPAAVAQVRQPVVLVPADFADADEYLPGAGGHSSDHTGYRDVVLCLDVRHGCGPPLAFAFETARSRGAALHVVHAWQLPHGRAATERAVAVRAEREAGWVLAAVVDPWREKYPSVDVRTRAAQGRPVHEVVRAAREAGLLIVGRQMRRGTVGSRTGRVTRLAIRGVSCPVAVVAHD
ncbi:MAG TPA: universal stress protein [Streptomyces sp.]|nr:universal stress protein [Streptomyces sp.]